MEVLLSTEMPTVASIANRNLLVCSPTTTVSEAAAMMRSRRYSSILVVREGAPVGIWTERDALRLDLSRPQTCDLPISAVMSTGVRTIPHHATVQEAGIRFKEEGVRHFLVVEDDGRPLGMVTQTDVVLNHGVEHYLTFREVHGVMTAPLVTLPGDTPLLQAARIINETGGEAAVVVNDGGEAGIVTERDIVRAVAERRIGGVLWELASRPVVTIPADASLLAARNRFVEHGIRHLAVVDAHGNYIGLLSFSNIMNAMQHEYARQLNDALRERDEALLRSRKDLFLARKVIESSQDGVMICRRDGTIEYVNPAFTLLTGYPAEEVLGRRPSILQSGRHDRAFYDRMWSEIFEKGSWQGEIWNRRKDGEVFAEWLTINAIRDEQGEVAQFAAVFSDITERKRMEEKVRNLAYFDALTGLPNRRLLLDRLQLAVANAHRHGFQLAVMFLDLDLFKRINDTLGHPVGDRVLVEVSRRLQGCLREGDTVARLGGDEFVILLPELIDTSDAGKLAERVIAEVKRPFPFDVNGMYVTTSLGVAIYPDDGEDAETLIRHADEAMYRAKGIGRNRYEMFSSQMNRSLHERMAMEQRLRSALDNEEMGLVYQVKVDLATGRMCGAEALVRWNSPDLGTVPPADFLPMVEKMGLMPRLGAWVLRTACAQNRRWQDLGLPPVRMAVNVSAHQFQDTRLADEVAAILSEVGLDAQYLELELTEDALVAHPKQVAEVLGRVAALGVRIAIDDFGTRHSNLADLKRLPIDALKIDRGLIGELHGAGQEAELVTAIIGLAHNLGLAAVAEGVETSGQADFLRRNQCDEIQGYLVARPVAAGDLESLFNRRLLPG